MYIEVVSRSRNSLSRTFESRVGACETTMTQGGKKRKAAAAAAASAPVQPASRVEYQAEKLTGKRAQKGGRSGTVVYTYEVQWKNGPGGKKYPNSFEPPECLVGWEKEMQKVDEQTIARAKQSFLKPLQVQRAEREAAAKKKAAELALKRDQLLRKKRRQSRAQFSEGEGEGEEEDKADEDDELLPDGEQLERELLAATMELEELQQVRRQPTQVGTAAVATAAAATAEAATEEATTPTSSSAHTHMRAGRSRVWLAFDRKTNLCQLPHPRDKTRKCLSGPGKGSGTSGHRAHLQAEHPDEWLHIQATGQVKTTVQMIEAAFAAKTDVSKPELGDDEKAELNRLVALWISKCGRPQHICEDAELRTVLARILVLCKARLRYELPCYSTVSNELKLLGHEGKALGRDFIVRLIKSGVKPSISGDLWSEGGMGLFGIFAHGITETWVMEKALIGFMVACEKERHTAENITKWTIEALEAIGVTAEGLLAPDTE